MPSINLFNCAIKFSFIEFNNHSWSKLIIWLIKYLDAPQIWNPMKLLEDGLRLVYVLSDQWSFDRASKNLQPSISENLYYSRTGDVSNDTLLKLVWIDLRQLFPVIEGGFRVGMTPPAHMPRVAGFWTLEWSGRDQQCSLLLYPFQHLRNIGSIALEIPSTRPPRPKDFFQ